jgi:deazaflavin-dependent oxidoreductase (nitroreductase family)
MFNDKIIEEFRANGGEVGGPFAGMKLLLITMKGAKSGKDRTYPLAYTRDGDNYVIIASKGGADTHPDWYYNLKANPKATVEVGKDKFAVEAHETQDPQREELYAKQAEQYPTFWDYTKKTNRKIPVFLLEKV